MPHGFTTLLALALTAPAPADDGVAQSAVNSAADARMTLAEARAAVLRFRDTDHVPLGRLIELVSDRNAEVRHATAVALSLRSQADRAAALPALVATLGNPGDSFVIGTLVGLGHDVVRPLSERLPDPKARDAVLDVFTQLGPAAGPAAGPVARLLADDDPKVRERAARALAAMRAEAEPAVPALVAALDDRERWVRVEAARALGNVGPAAGAALKPLGLLLADRDDYLRVVAAGAYLAISDDVATVLPVVAASLKSPNLETSRHAVALLYHMGPDAAPAVAALAEAARRPMFADKWYEGASIPAALWRIGGAGAPALAEMISDRRLGQLVRNDAAYCLGQIGPDAKDQVPALVRALENGDASARPSALGALRNIGPAAVAAAPQLRKVIRDDTDADRRSLAARVLATLIPHGPDAAGADAATEAVIPVLMDDLTRDEKPPPRDADADRPVFGGNDDWARWITAEALSHVERRAEGPLLAALKSAGTPGRAAAARALGLARSDAAAPALMEALQHGPDPLVREEAARALGRIAAGGAASAALADAANDPHEHVRAAAAEALVESKADPALTLRALVGLVSDVNVGEHACRDALRRLGDLGLAARPAAGELLKIANDPRHPNRDDAALALARTGGADAAVLIPVARDCFGSRHLRARTTGAKIAGALGPAAAPLVPELVGLLRDGDYPVRAAAADALASAGDTAAAALSELHLLYRMTLDTASRVAAVRALGVLGGRHDESVALLRRALRDDTWQVAFEAARAVRKTGGDPSAVLPRARVELRRRNADNIGESLAAAKRLGDLGTFAAPALPELQSMRDDPAEFPEIRRAVSQAIERLAHEPNAPVGDAARAAK